MGTVVEGSTSFTISTVPGGEALGMENGAIPDESITASSSAGPAPPHLARLNGVYAWCAGKSEDCYLQVDLGSLHLLCAVATQGNPGGNRDYVKRYKLLHSSDGVTWTVYEENGNNIIEGNTDNKTVKRKDLEQEVITRYVKFCPVDWYCWPCLRVELYGAALNIGEKIAELQTEEGGGFVLDKVLVTTYETPVHESGEADQDEDSLKDKEKTTQEFIIADNKDNEMAVDKDYQYQVHVYTGDVWGAGTDANVVITIFGEDGDSGENKLDNTSNNFERAQKDSFTVPSGTYLGRLTKIRIGHDNTGFGAAWFLDKVTIEDPKTGEAVVFSCQRWFSTSEDDGQITRELTRDDKDDLEKTVYKDYDYQVHVYTGDVWGAGTDANVVVTLIGEAEDSGERKLDKTGNNFERGQKDSFTVTCGSYLGRLTKIRIGHDNTGFGAAWFLDKVTVEDPQTGDAVHFSCQRWFSTSEDDGQITRELTRDDKDDLDKIIYKDHHYQLHVYTGDVWGAGTDANVVITIFGEDGDSGERKLDNTSNNFERAQKDSFTVTCGSYLGRLTKIKIGHDNTGFGAAWFLDKVTVEDPRTGEAVDFSCQRWFSTSDDDGQIIRELSRDDKDEEKIVDKEKVADLRPEEEVGKGAIAEEKIVELPPEEREGGEEKITDLPSEEEGVGIVEEKDADIQPEEGEGGGIVEEKDADIQPEVGEGGGIVEVKFAADLQSAEGGGIIEENITDLPSEGGEGDGTVEDHQYQVHVYTGDVWGAGTDANILITIFGEDGDSGEKKLDNTSNNFERAQKDSFTVTSGTYLGRLTKIRIGHDNTGFGAAWFLDKITVEDPKTEEEVDFSCHRWFSTNEDDGQIIRELSRDDKDEEKVAKDEIADLQSEKEGGFDEGTTYKTHVDKNDEPDQDEDSLKEQEKKIIREAKERQRKEEEQKNRLEEIQIIIEQEEGKRKPTDEDMDDERRKAEARIKLVLDEEKLMDHREKPDGQDESPQKGEGEVEDTHSPVTKEYSRIEDEHRKRMEEIQSILAEDEDRRNKEKEERRKAEEEARRKKEEERRKRDEEAKKKREEERLKWEEEHKKWEEERKRRDKELQEVLEEGRRKRAEDRRRREEELKKNREEERRKREEERKKRMEEEMKKLEDLRREREERWNKKAGVVIADVELTVQAKKEEEDSKNRQEEKKKKEEGWKKAVETPRKVEEEMKKFRDDERKRLEEERKKEKEKEHADAEAEKEFRSEIRVIRRGDEPDTKTHVTVATLQMGPTRDVTIAEEKRRIEWKMEKIEQDRRLREEEERKRQEEAERKRKEEEERLKQEEEKKRREQEEERERRREELRLKREEEEKRKREEEGRKREEEQIRRKMSLEEKRKRLEEDRKKREDEERIWRREVEERKQKEEEERRKQMESKKKKRLSIERKKFEEDEKKRLDEIERKRLEEEERARIEDEQRRRDERERWKMKQAEKRRSGEIYRRKSEEDLRNREDRASFKERQRKKRDSKSFETKWKFINGEVVPGDESFTSSVSSDMSYSEPNVFVDETPTKGSEEKTDVRDEKDSSRQISVIRVSTIPRTKNQDPRGKLHRTESAPTFHDRDKEVKPYRSQPRCDHLLPTDPAVQMAEEESFFRKFDKENEGKLRPFPSWYGSQDMGSLPHLYSPANPITDSDIDRLLAIESEDCTSWKRVKKSRELEIYSRKGTQRGSPPVTKAIMVLKDLPYRDAIDLVSDWDERSKWDKTFDGVSFLDQMADFKVLKCAQKKKNRCLVLASLDREDEEPYYAWAWKAANHPSVPGEDTKVTVLKMETGICGAVIRPYHDATRSSKITIITQVRGSVPSPLKSTYLTGNPGKWLIWLKKHHDSKVKNTVEKGEDDKNKDDSSSVSSKSDKQD